MSGRGRQRNGRGRGRGSSNNVFLRGVRMRSQGVTGNQSFDQYYSVSPGPPGGGPLMYYHSLMTGCMSQPPPDLSPPYAPPNLAQLSFGGDPHPAQPLQVNLDVQTLLNTASAQQQVSPTLRTGRVSVEELMGGFSSLPPPAPPPPVPLPSQNEAAQKIPQQPYRRKQQNVNVSELFRGIPVQQNNVRIIRPTPKSQPPAHPFMKNGRGSHHFSGPRQDGGGGFGRRPFYTPYMDKDVVQAGIKRGELIEGQMRVNQRNWEEAFIDDPTSETETDILILGLVDRNRAFHTDKVVVQVKPRHLWRVNEVLYKKSLEKSPKGKRRDEEDLWEDVGQTERILDSSLSSSASFQTAKEGLNSTRSPLRSSSSSSESSEGGPVVILDRNNPDTTRASFPSKTSIPSKEEIKSYNRKEMLDYGRELWTNPAFFAAVQPCPDFLDYLRQLSICGSGGCEDVGGSWLSSSQDSGSRKDPSTSPSHSKSEESPVGSGRGGGKKKVLLVEDFPGKEIPEDCLTKTATVVYISEKRHSRAAVGNLKTMTDGNRSRALFAPNDSRLPRMMIPGDQVPKGFFDRPQDFAKYIYIARVDDWQANSQLAKGKLCKSLGEAGEIEPETEGMLASHDISTEDFSQEAMDCLPQLNQDNKWIIPEEEYGKRRDFRDECVLTIDPTTARDLDDALHVKKTGDGLYEVGVHIADVSYFLSGDTVLNDEATKRATSVYLVHKVIPMLPRLLCEDLCSLNSGVERLAFSVLWKMDTEGEVHDVWFGRSVIRSRCKLTYDIAQGFLDEPERVWELSELPPISDGVDPSELSKSVNMLNAIAKKLKRKRYDAGALRLDQPKLSFALDADSGLPNGCSVYELKDSNRLIEEFMLLANMSVARKIYEHFPKISVLRRHPPPSKKMLREVLELCQKLGYPIDGSSAGDINRSLMRHTGGSERARGIMAVLSQLCMKPMKLAMYFCTGMIKDEYKFHHYALNVPFYTHFTSPIRRYPDVMVHRLLGAALGYGEMPEMAAKEVDLIAEHCNDKKASAKTVSELSGELFFCIFVKSCGPIEERGIVMNVLDHSMDILLVRYGIIKRVYCDKLEVSKFEWDEGPPPVLGLWWKGRREKQSLTICDMVDVVLTGMKEPNKYMATIKPPN